jgi:hypothetical protein
MKSESSVPHTSAEYNLILYVTIFINLILLIHFAIINYHPFQSKNSLIIKNRYSLKPSIELLISTVYVS